VAYDSIDVTLDTLDKFVKSKIKLEDFTVTDKQNLLEIFLMHETTLKQMRRLIFQNEVTDNKNLVTEMMLK